MVLSHSLKSKKMLTLVVPGVVEAAEMEEVEVRQVMEGEVRRVYLMVLR